jgi:hypothetical protein
MSNVTIPLWVLTDPGLTNAETLAVLRLLTVEPNDDGWCRMWMQDTATLLRYQTAAQARDMFLRLQRKKMLTFELDRDMRHRFRIHLLRAGIDTMDPRLPEWAYLTPRQES